VGETFILFFFKLLNKTLRGPTRQHLLILCDSSLDPFIL